VHIGGFTCLDVGGGFTLRGFGATSQLRDGFYRLGRYGSSNVDRMEIIKGSNAAIYGRTSPGGMVNMISKLPRDTERYSLSLNYGDYDTRRATIEATGPLFSGTLGRTSYILTASLYEKGFDIPYSQNRTRRLATTWTTAVRSAARRRPPRCTAAAAAATTTPCPTSSITLARAPTATTPWSTWRTRRRRTRRRRSRWTRFARC
jgi:outer membrane receptor protein involved in Fe transport